MSTKAFKEKTKELNDLTKKLLVDVPESANASEYAKAIDKALVSLRTFDKTSPTYVDYVEKALSKQEKKNTKDTDTNTKEEKTTKKRKASENGNTTTASTTTENNQKEPKENVTKKKKA